MSAQNGSTMRDILTNGWRRIVRDSNGGGSLSVVIPADFVEKHKIEKQDEVGIYAPEDDSGKLELYFETNE